MSTKKPTWDEKMQSLELGKGRFFDEPFPEESQSEFRPKGAQNKSSSAKRAHTVMFYPEPDIKSPSDSESLLNPNFGSNQVNSSSSSTRKHDKFNHRSGSSSTNNKLKFNYSSELPRDDIPSSREISFDLDQSPQKNNNPKFRKGTAPG